MKKETSRYSFPYVSVEEAVSFDPLRPETATKSHIVNALVDAFTKVRPLSTVTVTEYLGIPLKDLQGAIRCATGLNFNEFLTQWRIKQLYDLKGNPGDLTSDEIGQKLGFADRSSLWLFMKKNKIIEKKGYDGNRMFDSYRNPIYQNKKHR